MSGAAANARPQPRRTSEPRRRRQAGRPELQRQQRLGSTAGNPACCWLRRSQLSTYVTRSTVRHPVHRSTPPPASAVCACRVRRPARSPGLSLLAGAGSESPRVGGGAAGLHGRLAMGRGRGGAGRGQGRRAPYPGSGGHHCQGAWLARHDSTGRASHSRLGADRRVAAAARGRAPGAHGPDPASHRGATGAGLPVRTRRAPRQHSPGEYRAGAARPVSHAPRARTPCPCSDAPLRARWATATCSAPCPSSASGPLSCVACFRTSLPQPRAQTEGRCLLRHGPRRPASGPRRPVGALRPLVAFTRRATRHPSMFQVPGSTARTRATVRSGADLRTVAPRVAGYSPRGHRPPGPHPPCHAQLSARARVPATATVPRRFPAPHARPPQPRRGRGRARDARPPKRRPSQRPQLRHAGVSTGGCACVPAPPPTHAFTSGPYIAGPTGNPAVSLHRFGTSAVAVVHASPPRPLSRRPAVPDPLPDRPCSPRPDALPACVAQEANEAGIYAVSPHARGRGRCRLTYCSGRLPRQITRHAWIACGHRRSGSGARARGAWWSWTTGYQWGTAAGRCSHTRQRACTRYGASRGIAQEAEAAAIAACDDAAEAAAVAARRRQRRQCHT